MTNAIFELVTGNESLEELIDSVAKLQKQLDFMMNHNLGSKNIRELGGWLVGPDYFKSRNGMVGISSLVTGADDIRFWAGDDLGGTPPFRVYESGKLYASNAEISGLVTATSGRIGGWTISGNSLTSSTSSYPRVVMDPSNNEFSFYASGTQYVRVGASSIVVQPFIEFANGNREVSLDLSTGGFYIRSVGATDVPIIIDADSADVYVTGDSIDISANDIVTIEGADIYLDPYIGGSVFVNFDELYDGIFGADLETRLDDKADYFSGHTGNVVVGDGLGGTITLKFDNGVLTDVL